MTLDGFVIAAASVLISAAGSRQRRKRARQITFGAWAKWLLC